MARVTHRPSHTGYELLHSPGESPSNNMEGTDGKDSVLEPAEAVDLSEEPNRSRPFGDHDDLEGLTLFEKKCVLINREIDSNGMGRYQWY